MKCQIKLTLIKSIFKCKDPLNEKSPDLKFKNIPITLSAVNYVSVFKS